MSCTAVLNSTDLSGAGLRAEHEQAASSAEFYALSDEVLANLDDEVERSEALISFLMEHCPYLNRGSFLDFGAGRGCLAAAASTRVFSRALASELDLTMLRKVLPHLPNNDRITLVSEPSDLPPLDAVAAWHVLEHLPDVKLVMEPVIAHLKPGGAFFFQVPLLRNDYLVHTHYTFFGEASARAACSRLGLEMCGVWYDHDCDFLTCIARRPIKRAL